VPYIVRKDLKETRIPAVNTDEFYGNKKIAKMKFIGWVNEISYEDEPNGCLGNDDYLAKFRDPRGHIALFFSSDLEWQD
jgi:hypothetical protein